MNALVIYSSDTPGEVITPHTPLPAPPARPATPEIVSGVRRVVHGQVSKLLQAARQNDLSQDLAYMPYQNTYLSEAVAYLRQQGMILIQGGRINYTLGVFTLRVLGDGLTKVQNIEVKWYEVRLLLKANYMPRAVVKVPTLEPDSSNPVLPLFVPEVAPVVETGVGLVAYRRLGSDIDTLPETAWEDSFLDPTGLEKYMGATLIGVELCNVWYSEQDEAFVAQKA